MQWEQWLIDLITYFREKYNKLSKEQKKYISNLDNFEFPCQVDVLWVKNKQLDSHYQVLIFTHFKEEPDLSFHIYETSEPHRFSEIAEEMLQQPKWHKTLPRTESYRFMKELYNYQTYCDYLLFLLSNQYMMMKQYFENISLRIPIASRVGSPSKIALFNEAGNSMWDVWGDITTVNPREIVDDIIKEAKLHPHRHEEGHKSLIKDKKPKSPRGYGALLYPLIWIGKLPEQSTKDKIERKFLQAETILNTQYQNSTIVLRQDGFLGIVLQDEADESKIRIKALESLNEIIATCVLLGIPLYTIREPDLSQITVDPNTYRIVSMSWYPSTYGSPSQKQEDMWGSILPSSLFFDRRLIPQKKLRNAISKAEEWTKDKIKRNTLMFLLEANTLFANSEYPQSFLSSWIIIENHIRKLWEKYLKSKDTDKKRVSKLISTHYWDIDHLLENLNLSGYLTDKEYDQLMKLKKARNDIVHSGYKASKKEAEECFQLAHKITKELCDLK